MKLFRNKFNKNLLLFCVFYSLCTLIYASNDLSNRKVSKTDRVTIKGSSKENSQEDNKFSVDLKIIDKELNKEDKIKVDIDLQTFYDKNGLVFKPEDQIKGEAIYPFYNKQENIFFIERPNIIVFELKRNENHDETNILKLEINITNNYQEKYYILEFDFDGFFSAKLDKNQLKEKFVNKLQNHQFEQKFRRQLNELNSYINEISTLQFASIKTQEKNERLKKQNEKYEKNIQNNYLMVYLPTTQLK